MESLHQLLDGCPDVAEQILTRLPLASLPALAATSRALRALVAKLPESLWQVSLSMCSKASTDPYSHAQHAGSCQP